MRRAVAIHTEVIHRADDPSAEEVMPRTIHNHSCRERILWTGQPSREFQPPALPWIYDWRVRDREGGQETARYCGTETFSLASDAHFCIRDTLPVADPMDSVTIGSSVCEQQQFALQPFVLQAEWSLFRTSVGC